jgi:hypothetical protein
MIEGMPVHPKNGHQTKTKKEKENDEKIEKRSWGVLFSGAMAGRKKGEQFLFPFY